MSQRPTTVKEIFPHKFPTYCTRLTIQARLAITATTAKSFQHNQPTYYLFILASLALIALSAYFLVIRANLA